MYPCIWVVGPGGAGRERGAGRVRRAPRAPRERRAAGAGLGRADARDVSLGTVTAGRGPF